MQTKLTLRMEQRLVRDAKAYAKRTGRSLSQLVADYFSILAKRSNGDQEDLTPLVRSLKGALGQAEMDDAEYRRHLVEKYL